MKTKTQYICEQCGTAYETEAECLSCEASHKPKTLDKRVKVLEQELQELRDKIARMILEPLVPKPDPPYVPYPWHPQPKPWPYETPQIVMYGCPSAPGPTWTISNVCQNEDGK